MKRVRIPNWELPITTYMDQEPNTDRDRDSRDRTLAAINTLSTIFSLSLFRTFAMGSWD